MDPGWVLGQLGAGQGRHDPHLWRLGGGTIAVDGQRFRDLTRSRDGAGAVELPVDGVGCDYAARAVELASLRGPIAVPTRQDPAKDAGQPWARVVRRGQCGPRHR